MATLKNSEKTRDQLKKIEYRLKQILLLALFFGWRKTYFINALKSEIKIVKNYELIDKNSYIESFALTFMNEFDRLSKIVDRKKLYIQRDKDTITNKQKQIVQEVINIIPKNKDNFSIYTKFDLDLDQFKQLSMVRDAIVSGKDLFWLSAHVDCSERCKRWQGKLVSMTMKSIDSTFWTGKKIEGHKIYSFIDIETKDNAYGVGNSIINGYHCRHFLYEWKSGSKPMNPNTTRASDIRYQNFLKKRKLERYIKERKWDARLWKGFDIKEMQKIRNKIARSTLKYKALCKEYGFIFETSAIEI